VAISSITLLQDTEIRHCNADIYGSEDGHYDAKEKKQPINETSTLNDEGDRHEEEEN
jgi:hypothetical protein